MSKSSLAQNPVLVNPISPCEVHWSLSEISRALGVSTTLINSWVDKGVFRKIVTLPGGKGERRIPDSAFREFLESATSRFSAHDTSAARHTICDFQGRNQPDF